MLPHTHAHTHTLTLSLFSHTHNKALNWWLLSVNRWILEVKLCILRKCNKWEKERERERGLLRKCERESARAHVRLVRAETISEAVLEVYVVTDNIYALHYLRVYRGTMWNLLHFFSSVIWERTIPWEKFSFRV